MQKRQDHFIDSLFVIRLTGATGLRLAPIASPHSRILATEANAWKKQLAHHDAPLWLAPQTTALQMAAEAIDWVA